MFFIFAGCEVVYLITATLFLPDTKSKTLEEVEKHFEAKMTDVVSRQILTNKI